KETEIETEEFAVEDEEKEVEAGDLNELETQLDVLEQLVDALDEDGDHVLNVIADMLEKIIVIPTVPNDLKNASREASETIAQIRREELKGDDFRAAQSTIQKSTSLMRERLETLKVDCGESAAREEDQRADAEEAVKDVNEFIERQHVYLEVLEQKILDLENAETGATGEIFEQMEIVLEETQRAGQASLVEFLKKLLSRMETIEDARDEKTITALLNSKDVILDYVCCLAEDSSAELDGERIAEILTALGSSRVEKKAAPASVKKPARKIPVVTVDVNNPEIVEFITEGREYLQFAEVALIAYEKEPDNKEHLNEIFRGFHNVKGISGFLQLADVMELSHYAESLMGNAREGKLRFTTACASVALETIDTLKEMIVRVDGALGGEKYVTPDGYTELLDKLENPNALDAEETQEEAGQTEGDASAEKLEPAKKDDKKFKARKTVANGMVKVSTARLDNLIDTVGELVIANAMVTQEQEIQDTTNPRLAKNVSHLAKITRELQELATSMRMVSMKSTFQKMSRIARELSVKSGVPVDFAFSGEDTELDRNVVEEIGSPLVHMVRNAVDHGIETSDERVAIGKSKKGSVRLSAQHEGGNVVIRLKDDGRGLDKKKILEKAGKLGLINEGDELSDREIFDLIFHAGFSTAEKVTDVSGRGVGMDVVRKSIENLRGRVDIDSEPGRGTTFTIRLPLTLAIIDGMVVTVGDERYVIPTISIIESLRPTREQIKTVTKKGEMLSLRGELLPLFRLHRLFDQSNAKTDPTEALVVIISGDRTDSCAILVDDLVDQQQVVIKSLGKMFNNTDGISGGAIMGDGCVALIIDTSGLARLAQ
ncbi:MAG: chemotaxis protein CheW, partial [Victivallales bacterium]|nr:chemotaxis protein CheW [Victivallales bacterium]